MNREELSVLLLGKLLKREIAPLSVNADDFLEPYRTAVLLIQDNQDWDYNLLIQKVGYFPIDQARTAAEKERSLPADWPKLLREVAIKDDVSESLTRIAKRLKRGESVEPTEVMEQAFRLSGDQRSIATMADVVAAHNPWRRSFWNPLDAFVGGYPAEGLTVTGAPPGTGKSSLMLKLAICAAEADKRVMLFSMEMGAPFLKYRMEQLKAVEDEYKGNIKVCDDILTPYDVASIATLIHDEIWFIGIDFAERMMLGFGDKTEAMMARAYNTLDTLAKRLKVPVFLLSQLNRGYEAGLPSITNLRYTGMAEILASLVLLIYNKNAIQVSQSANGALPATPGKAYIIVGKSRYGNIIRRGGRFAVQVDWDGEKGWGDVGHLFPL